jgi:hypothetical protein
MIDRRAFLTGAVAAATLPVLPAMPAEQLPEAMNTVMDIETNMGIAALEPGIYTVSMQNVVHDAIVGRYVFTWKILDDEE